MLRKACNYVKRKKRMVNNFNIHSEFFQSGEYRISNSMNYIYLKNEQIDKKVKNMFSRKSNKIVYKIFITFIKKMFFNKDIIIRDSNNNISKFCGVVYLPANNNTKNKDAKIFDFKKEHILSIYSIEYEYTKDIEDYNYFKYFFKIPNIISSDNQRLLSVEEIINFKSNKDWSYEDYTNVMSEIFKNYINYFTECKKADNLELKTPIQLLDIIELDEIKEFLKKNINIQLLNYKFPFIKMHGDLWSSNILIDKEDKENIYFIDWEHSENFILFYDFFWLLQNEAIYNNNYFYLNEYLDGKYDYDLRKMFSLFNIEFKTIYKVDYLVIFFVNVFETRLIDKDKKTNNVVFNRFKNLLNIIYSK